MRRWAGPDYRMAMAASPTTTPTEAPAATNQNSSPTVPKTTTKPELPPYKPPPPHLPATAIPYYPPMKEERQDSSLQSTVLQRIRPQISNSAFDSPKTLLEAPPPHSSEHVVMQHTPTLVRSPPTTTRASITTERDLDSPFSAKLQQQTHHKTNRHRPAKQQQQTPPPFERTSIKSTPLSNLLFGHSTLPVKGDQRKVSYQQFGNVSVLTIVESGGAPTVTHPNHLLVQVEASTVTIGDCLMRRGFDFNVLNPVTLPQTPGMDIVGYVASSGSPDFPKGSRVAALVRNGGNARYISVPISSLVKVPSKLEATQVVSLVTVYTTAYQVLKKIKQKGPIFSLLGKKVLIVGGMDAVGQALLQMCSKARAELYATAPQHMHWYVKKTWGATPLSEDPNDWDASINGSMDYVFDGVCLDGIESSYQALTPDGQLVTYGHKSMLRNDTMGLLGAPLTDHLHNLWKVTYPRAQSLDIWESFERDPDTYKKNLKSLCQLLKWKKLKASVTKTVSPLEVADAQLQLENDELFGIVVCLPWAPIQPIAKE